MRSLAQHLSQPRRGGGASRLVLFDIDGTILDLQAVSRDCEGVSGLRPFRGVLDVIRWLTLQPGVEVGLNTSRVERRRAETLESLNALGREYRVAFPSDRLVMRAHESVDPRAAKAVGLQKFRDAGFEIAAVVDDDPSAIESMRDACRGEAVLFLLASTLQNARRRVGPGVVTGSKWDVTRLAPDLDLPEHVRLVWDCIDSDDLIDEFLKLPVHVAAFDVRVDPAGRLVVRRDSFELRPPDPSERCLPLERALDRVLDAGRGLRLKLALDFDELPRIVTAIGNARANAQPLWFSASLERLREAGFQLLAREFPTAIVQCPVDFLEPLVVAFPNEARRVLDRLRDAGINRFSLSWTKSRLRAFASQLLDWGLDVNIDDVRNFEDYLQAALLVPRSLAHAFSPTSSRTSATSSSMGSVPHNKSTTG